MILALGCGTGNCGQALRTEQPSRVCGQVGFVQMLPTVFFDNRNKVLRLQSQANLTANPLS